MRVRVIRPHTHILYVHHKHARICRWIDRMIDRSIDRKKER